jgi:hypothetical protein
MKVTYYREPPRDSTGEGPHKSVCTISNFSSFRVLPIVVKLNLFYFPRMQPSHKSDLADFNSGNFPLDRNNSPFLAHMTKLFRCHNLELALCNSNNISNIGCHIKTTCFVSTS